MHWTWPKAVALHVATLGINCFHIVHMDPMPVSKLATVSGNDTPENVGGGPAQKRARMLESVRSHDAYKRYKGLQEQGWQLPATPRLDLPKRAWERACYKWRHAIWAAYE